MKKTVYFLLFPLFIINIEAQPLAGTYSIGADGSFTNLGEALNVAMQNGLSGPVYLDITSAYNSASETFPLTITNFQGLSSLNTMTIRPAAGTDSVIISTAGAQVFMFDGCSNVTVDGRQNSTGSDISLTIRCTGASDAVSFINGASSNNIKYVRLEGDNTTGNLVHISSGSLSGSSYNKLMSCEFTSLDNSSFPGSAVTISGGYPINKGNTFEDCLVENFNETGISIAGYSDSTIITNSYFHQTAPANAISISAIKIDNAANILITRNRIKGFGSVSQGFSEVNGILVGVSGDFTQSSAKIFNNFITLSPDSEANSATISGIKYAGKRGCSFEAYNNTILISGTDDYGRFSYCINKTDTASVFMISNNILVNQRVTLSCPGKQYCLNVPVISGFSSDFNTFHNGDCVPTVGSWGGADLYIFEDWQNITKQDSNSNFIAVEFMSSYDLHLTGLSLGNRGLIAQVVPGIDIDIDGDMRSPNFPYKGGDENNAYPLPVELISFNCGVSVDNVILTWETATEANNYGFEIERNSAEGWMTLAFIPGHINSQIRNSYTFTDQPGYGIFSYRLKQVDLEGSFSYSVTITAEVRGAWDFSLMQNYPNPFNPSTRIRFTLPEKSHTSLKIYDVTGQLVENITDKVLDIGSHSYNFNAAGLPGGIYFYELISGASRIVRKMCLIK